MITAVTGFGLFVELTDIYVEGLVHVSALPGDYYHFDPVHHRLAGERTGRSFRLGDTIEVKVMRVDLDERKIDFEVSEKTLAAPIGRKQRGAAPVAEKAEQQPATEAKATPKPRSRKSEASEAYFPKDAVQRNAEVRKSREMKKALMTDARSSAGSKSEKGGKPSGKPTKHRKGPPKSGAPRKNKSNS
ncbi:Ribonuclease R [compost metagenome]